MVTKFRNIAVAGITFRPVPAQIIATNMDAATKLTLIREPGNKYDKNAIRIYADGEWIGFIPAISARTMAPMLDRGDRVEIVMKPPFKKFDVLLHREIEDIIDDIFGDDSQIERIGDD